VVTVLEVDLDLFQEVVQLSECVREAVGEEDLLCSVRAVCLGSVKLESESELLEVPDKGWIL
jgi:hypothetical protein